MKRVALSAFAFVLGACAPSPSGSPAASSRSSLTPSTSAVPPSAISTTQAGGLVVTEIAEGNAFSAPVWAPGGGAFAVAWGWGMPSPGEADLYSADGRQLARLSGVQSVAWLDASTFATFDGSMVTPNGAVVVHSTSGNVGIVAAAASLGILGSGTPRLAIRDAITANPATIDSPRFRVFGQDGTSRPGDEAWSNAAEYDGSPIAWSPDGTLLATHVDPKAATVQAAGAEAVWHPAEGDSDPLEGAGGQIPIQLVVRRYPGGEVVPTPNVVFDARADWVFSPDGRYLAGGSVTQATSIVDLQTNQLINVPFGHASWTTTGELVLVYEGQPPRLWHPDGSITTTDLPPGTPTYGPLAGEVFLNPPFEPGAGATATVEMGGRSASIPLPLNAPGGSASWAPDGSACYVATYSDDAQLLDARLYRVSLP